MAPGATNREAEFIARVRLVMVPISVHHGHVLLCSWKGPAKRRHMKCRSKMSRYGDVRVDGQNDRDAISYICGQPDCDGSGGAGMSEGRTIVCLLGALTEWQTRPDCIRTKTSLSNRYASA